tara:strand:- start:89 stop:415 length:327 start_codon:yes stop_codon:yes gene_type:complete
MICYSFQKIKFLFIFFIYTFIPLNPLIASQFRYSEVIDFLVWSCYKDINFCNEALFQVNNYQKISATNKKFSCQTRLLGLEANLIMAMNSNFKRTEAKSIIDAIKKYC